jgi:hypothetical protein
MTEAWPTVVSCRSIRFLLCQTLNVSACGRHVHAEMTRALVVLDTQLQTRLTQHWGCGVSKQQWCHHLPDTNSSLPAAQMSSRTTFCCQRRWRTTSGATTVAAATGHSARRQLQRPHVPSWRTLAWQQPVLVYRLHPQLHLQPPCCHLTYLSVAMEG